MLGTIGVGNTQLGQAVVALIVAFTGYFLKRKTDQIHVLVNSRLQTTLDQLATATRRVEELESQLATLIAANAAKEAKPID